jgi:hypothetical protein
MLLESKVRDDDNKNKECKYKQYVCNQSFWYLMDSQKISNFLFISYLWKRFLNKNFHIIIQCNIFWVMRIKIIFLWVVNHNFKNIFLNRPIVLCHINFITSYTFYNFFVKLLWFPIKKNLSIFLAIYLNQVQKFGFFKVLQPLKIPI